MPRHPVAALLLATAIAQSGTANALSCVPLSMWRDQLAERLPKVLLAARVTVIDISADRSSGRFNVTEHFKGPAAGSVITIPFHTCNASVNAGGPSSGCAAPLIKPGEDLILLQYEERLHRCAHYEPWEPLLNSLRAAAR